MCCLLIKKKYFITVYGFHQHIWHQHCKKVHQNSVLYTWRHKSEGLLKSWITKKIKQNFPENSAILWQWAKAAGGNLFDSVYYRKAYKYIIVGWVDIRLFRKFWNARSFARLSKAPKIQFSKSHRGLKVKTKSKTFQNCTKSYIILKNYIHPNIYMFCI